MTRVFIYITIFILNGLSSYAQQKWDRPMELKTYSISIQADQFIATTFMEMEFCNPNGKEIEGLYRFELRPGQVITAFQLELNGKYRDGSIEEKWKATNAYNSIVGKRIDPALLTMEYADHYSLRIYPVPAHGCRKVTITVQQVLVAESKSLTYTLPLHVTNEVKEFSLQVRVKGISTPVAKPGLIKDLSFTGSQEMQHLEWAVNDIFLRTPVSFSYPISPGTELCTKPGERDMHFALRVQPSVPREYVLNLRSLTVYWDASASVSKRDVNREINFLKQFVSLHNITQLTIIPFNSRLLDTAVFYTGNKFNSRWHHYLQDISYDGATQLGLIDLNDKSADAVLVFTDGNNTYGKSKPRKGAKPVFCIHTSSTANLTSLNQIVGTGGGKVIDLNKSSISAALSASRNAENWLINVTSSSGKLMTEQIMPLKPGDFIFLNGVTQLKSDTIYLQYGNESLIHHTEKVTVNQDDCQASSIDRITMLNNFNQITRTYSWSNLIDFGIQEKVVTPNTAYIVLERVEDYVRYNITPPKELEAECEKLNYVKRDTRWDRRKIENVTDFTIIKNVVDRYNERARKSDPNAKTIYLDRQEFDKQMNRSIITDETNPTSAETALNEKIAGVANHAAALEEVVVTGYGMARRKELTGSVTHISASDIFQGSSTVAQVLQGKVPGIQITNSTGVSERNATILMRGSATLSSANQPLFTLDGIPVAGNINDVVNVLDIESVTVLKGQAGFSLYGSRAANGVVVIKTKRGKNNYNVYNNKPYRLKDMEDVAFLSNLKAVPVNEKITMYEKLKEEYGGEPGFYIDVAQHFFERGLKQSAFSILMNAGEAANGGPEVTTAMAYVLESWGAFVEAIILYEQLLEENPGNLILHSDLAWCLYQQGKYQEAVDVLYKAIRMNTGELEYSNLSLKAVLLNDMNAMIGLHRDILDLSSIPSTIIQSLPADLRLMITYNKNYLGHISVKDPSGMINNDRDVFPRNNGVLNYNAFEYQQIHAKHGKYKVSINHSNYDASAGRVPSVIRIRRFRDFGRPDQRIEIENIMMDNQHGEIEIAEFTR